MGFLMHGILNTCNFRRLFYTKGLNVGAVIPGHAAEKERERERESALAAFARVRMSRACPWARARGRAHRRVCAWMHGLFARCPWRAGAGARASWHTHVPVRSPARAGAYLALCAWPGCMRLALQRCPSS